MKKPVYEYRGELPQLCEEEKKAASGEKLSWWDKWALRQLVAARHKGITFLCADHKERYLAAQKTELVWLAVGFMSVAAIYFLVGYLAGFDAGTVHTLKVQAWQVAVDVVKARALG